MPRRPLLLLASLAAASPAWGQPHVQTLEEALEQDAAEYARNQGVGIGEARRRLLAQQQSVAATDLIRREFHDRLAGIAIVHRPVFGIEVLLAGSQPVPGRVLIAGGMPVPITFRTGARATREQVLAAIRDHQAAIREIMPQGEGMGHDPRTGALIIMADRSDLGGATPAQMAARIEAVTGVPVLIRILDSRDSDSSFEGGARVEGSNPDDPRRYFCTTGFTVTDGNRTGIVTAAHCPDELTLYGPGGTAIPLRFVGQWGAQFQDVQVHLGQGGERAVFYSDTAKARARPLTGARLRSSTRAGETVCHRGEASGYSCAEVEYVDYAPPGDLCGGPCHPVWVTVNGPTCRGGDSGGPVFAGTLALGIVKGSNFASGGRCNFYYYMSTDYLPPGWSLLLAPPVATPEAVTPAAPTP